MRNSGFRYAGMSCFLTFIVHFTVVECVLCNTAWIALLWIKSSLVVNSNIALFSTVVFSLVIPEKVGSYLSKFFLTF